MIHFVLFKPVNAIYSIIYLGKATYVFFCRGSTISFRRLVIKTYLSLKKITHGKSLRAVQ